MTAEVELRQRELNYPGVVNPPAGQLMGPGLDGRVWSVVGAMYDTATKVSTVSVVELPPELAVQARGRR